MANGAHVVSKKVVSEIILLYITHTEIYSHLCISPCHTYIVIPHRASQTTTHPKSELGHSSFRLQLLLPLRFSALFQRYSFGE